ncbi:hypothetical protein CRG98_033810 [Punica granatum]|uniref:Uncharacterized protein n=1 Tax=Punica granatum TaxID=22663 RepID=A0A2I0IQ19_PUNGR|nr:hypothetical protein CRG98_033810 [Punica granatum]
MVGSGSKILELIPYKMDLLLFNFHVKESDCNKAWASKGFSTRPVVRPIIHHRPTAHTTRLGRDPVSEQYHDTRNLLPPSVSVNSDSTEGSRMIWSFCLREKNKTLPVFLVGTAGRCALRGLTFRCRQF